ncbi:MFS general substrate transporter [Lophium mytilinum]|uniref:MFS general substrate transporter n=1 Tax=Lophium mytilinum TaxID=390894 RepID=A0A6A6QK82_9PEZI|nr:MFS general substrate transporter [Lophium mytilinum]
MEKEEVPTPEARGSGPVSENHEHVEHIPADVSDAEFKWDFDIIVNLAALYIVFFASTWMLIVPSSIIGFITEAFPTEADKSVWIATAITISNCVLSSFVGLLSDILGRKVFVLIGMVLGLIGTLVSSRANGMEQVIGGQVLSGCGLTIGYLAIALTQEIVPKDKRPITQAITAVAAGVATIIGPIIGGAFIKHEVGGVNNGWRGPFYLGAGFFFIAFFTTLFFYNPGPRPNPENLPIKTRLAHVDWLGIFLVAAGLTLFLVGLFYGGNPDKWTSARVLAPLIVGAILLIIFGIYEWIGTKTGLLAHVLFKHRNFPIALSLNFVGGIVLFGGQAFLPQEIIQLYTSDAVLTGVDNLPFSISAVVGGALLFVAFLFTKNAKPITIVSLSIIILGSGLMAVMEPHINYAAWFFPTVLLGLSVGLQTAVVPLIVSVCTPNHAIGTAIMISNSARSFGGSIGTVIFQQIFAHKIKEILPKKVVPAVLKAGLPQTSLPSLLEAFAAQSQALIAQVPGFTPAVYAALTKSAAKAYADSFRYIWYSLLAFACACTILSFFLESTTAMMTHEVAAQVEHGHHHINPLHHEHHENGHPEHKHDHEHKEEV